MTVVNVLIFLAAIILGAILESIFHIFNSKEEVDVKLFEDLNTCNNAKKELEVNLDKTKLKLSEVQQSNVEFTKNLNSLSENIQSLEDENDKLKFEIVQLTARLEEGTPGRDFTESSVFGYLYNGALVTITNTSPKNIKTIKEKGTKVKLHY